ncbi:MAG TPA: hydroxymethylbilane synthase [Chitinophagaceae bacterium]|nr:hydroxymethylbilane synthase [Chitinophagaceae bacterium]
MPARLHMEKHLPDTRSDGETIRLVGRSSRLSLLQIEIVQNKIKTAFPEMKVEIIAKSSKGDELQGIPLHTVEGSDFFTQDIFDALKNGEADIAIHSLKDMSGEHFFGENKFAIVDRDDARDVTIFNNDIEEKIASGKTIIIGTCSPRREEMATVFLKKALPQLNDDIKIETKSIRGNVETRLRKLNNGEYDATILAMAGLNRLLNSAKDAALIKELLKDKKLMVLPLIECVPAPCQGAVVAEAYYENEKAIAVLKKINNEKLFADCVNEKKAASEYGKGCLQQFGVTTIPYGNNSTLYAAGKDENGKQFSHWYYTRNLKQEGNIFSAADHVKDFFQIETLQDIQMDENIDAVYIASNNTVHSSAIQNAIQNKRIWAAGTHTWYGLAKKGMWVEGCADGLGLELLTTAWQSSLISLSKEKAQILTNQLGVDTWKKEGWEATATYHLFPHLNNNIIPALKNSSIFFWTSFHQYECCKNILPDKAVHCCPAGKTAQLFRNADIEPKIFPTIAAFKEWKKEISIATSVG